MIHLTYSNRTEALLDGLVRALHRPRDPLASVRIVVPNRNVERYVELGVARQLGVAANLRFCRLGELARELLPGPLLTDQALLARLLRGLLNREFLDSEPLAPVRRYLHAAGDQPSATEPRRAQLALHLSHLFEEYGLSRPELLRAWERSEARFSETPYAQTERWQAALFRFVLGVGGAQTVAGAIERMAPPPFETLHVFGLSYVARVFAQLLSEIGQHAELRLYSLNPCEEFWEDLETEGELRRRQRRSDAEPEWLFDDDPFLLDVQTETPLLRRWGRPGREHVRLLGALTECDFESAFIDPVGELEAQLDADLPLFAAQHRPPLLRRLQHDILTRAPRPEAPPAAPRDRSVTVLACPSVRREVETVAVEIWSLIEHVDDLTFDQIAVLVNGPDRDLYLPHVEAVFQEARDIPFNVADRSLASMSPLVEGAMRLLALPAEAFTRAQVLEVLTHPAVLARVPDVTPADWRGLVDRLGIFRGIRHEELEGTYIGDEDRLTWEQGLHRIALGALARARVDGRPREIAFGDHHYLPEEAPVGSLMEAQFALLTRSLTSDVRFARENELRLSDWARFVGAMLQTYLTPSSEAEQTALRRALSVAESLTALDLDGAEVSYPVVWELLRGQLEALVGGRGQQLADGVAVSTLVPMRAIPFRVIFVLGLGEGRFPAPDRRDSMDLRAARRYAGDVTPPERDRYTFLETLLCAREHLVLSYVARDERTGDPTAPSAVVTELLEVIERGYLPGARTTLVRKDIPLRRHEAEETRDVLPEAAAESIAAQLGAQRAAALPPPALATARLAADEPLRAALGLAPLPARASRTEASRVRISTSALRRFLECPLQGWTRAVLRLGDERSALEGMADEEPFAPSRLDETTLLRASFVESKLAGGPPMEVYSRLVRAASARGRWPLGSLAQVTRSHHEEILERWERGYHQLGFDPTELRPHRLRIGATASEDRGVHVEDPIALRFDVDPRSPERAQPLTVELVGTTELLVGEGSRCASVNLLLRHRGGQRGRVEELRHGLRAFFDLAIRAALGREPEGHRSAQLYADRERPVVLRYKGLTPTDARAWLRDLVADLIGDEHTYLMPIEAVLRLADRLGAGADAQTAALAESVAFVRDRWGGGQSRFGPVRDAIERPIPEAARLGRVVERRFGPWLRRVETP